MSSYIPAALDPSSAELGLLNSWRFVSTSFGAVFLAGVGPKFLQTSPEM